MTESRPPDAIPNHAPTDSPFTDPKMEEIRGRRDKGRATRNRVPDDRTAIGEIARLLMTDQNNAGGLVPSVQRWLVKTGYVRPGRGGLRDAIRELDT